MSWTILIGLVITLALAVLIGARRRIELASMARHVDELATAREKGSRQARLQYPHVDLSRCLGCGTCIQACPENGVLELIHGQAIVVHGARCVGHGVCARECPTGAIQVTLGDLENRRDIPSLSESFEAVNTRGLFLGGEVTGYALIRTALQHGVTIADEVARRLGDVTRGPRDVLDLCVVGAGPAGLACSLQAKSRGLHFMTLDQDTLGGTVAKYPRRKLVMTQPVELPLYGKLNKLSYEKEELIDLWNRVAKEQDLPIHTGVRLDGVKRRTDGTFEVQTSSGVLITKNVCLALGRRGTPRKLEVPGEDLPKVAYSLIDAQSYEDRRILVVGGGDSAVEAALGLSHQPGNEVTLSYRKEAFFRIKAKNEEGLSEAVQKGSLRVLFESQVTRIEELGVELRVGTNGSTETVALDNDDVFVMVGGIPPFRVLEESGVSFDPADRPTQALLADRGTGIFRALVIAFGLALCASLWIAAFSDYYRLPSGARPDSRWHQMLSPSGTVGLAFGVTAAALILANLSYLLRRIQRIPLRFGSLRVWMTSHVVTGILALLFALIHSAMAIKDTVGGHALLGLAVLVITGAIGRYFYSYVPRAANGRELALDEVKGELTSLSAEWDREHRAFGETVRAQIQELVAEGRWSGSYLTRVASLARAQLRLRRLIKGLRKTGAAEGIPPDQLQRIMGLAKRAQRTALITAHFEDVRTLLATWRYLHRWVALLMVLLVGVHVFVALKFGELG